MPQEFQPTPEWPWPVGASLGVDLRCWDQMHGGFRGHASRGAVRAEEVVDFEEARTL